MRFAKKSDIIIIVVVLVFAVGLGIFYYGALQEGGAIAEVYYFDNVIDTVDLTSSSEMELVYDEAPHVKIHVGTDGGIYFEQSDCPDKVCIKSGTLLKVGQSAACLPNGILIKLTPKGERSSDDADIIIK